MLAALACRACCMSYHILSMPDGFRIKGIAKVVLVKEASQNDVSSLFHTGRSRIDAPHSVSQRLTNAASQLLMADGPCPYHLTYIGLEDTLHQEVRVREQGFPASRCVHVCCCPKLSACTPQAFRYEFSSLAAYRGRAVEASQLHISDLVVDASCSCVVKISAR